MSEQEEVNTFDIIVVGSGTSGLLLVHELATLCPHLKILVIERGKRYCDQLPCVRSSLDWGTASTLDSKSVDSPTIQFETAPHCDLYGRTIKCPVGNGVGGSSNINAMIWTAGHRSVFDRYWPSSWNADNMDRVLEIVQPLLVCHQHNTFSMPCHLSAIVHFNANKKQNLRNIKKRATFQAKSNDSAIWADSMPCCYSYFATATEGSSDRPREPQRQSLREHLLEPLLRKSSAQSFCSRNLGGITLMSQCEVLRVILDPINQHKPTSYQDQNLEIICTGVVIKDHVTGLERVVKVRAHGEVILCAGVFASPRILLNSIKPLSTISFSPNCVDRVLKSRNIGSCLQDHTILPFMALGNWWMLNEDSCHLFSHDKAVVPFNNLPPNSVHGWIYLDEFGRPLSVNNEPELSQLIKPCCQLLFVDGRVLPGMFTAQMIPNFGANRTYTAYIRPFLVFIMECLVSFRLVQWCLSCTFGVLLCRVQPPSVCGSVTAAPGLDSSCNSLEIGFNESQHSSRGRFMPLMLALDTVRRILQDFRVSSSKKFWFLELLPGPLFLYCHFEACFSCFYKCFVNTYYHYCGTCKMTSPGSNDDSVVDDELRVQGCKSLRIADASIFPWIPSGPIAATAMAVGVNAAQLVARNARERVEIR